MTIVFAWLARGGWKFAAGIGVATVLLFALLHYGHSRYAAGVAAQFAVDKKAADKAALYAANLKQQRDDNAARADTIGRDALAAQNALAANSNAAAKGYYDAHPAAIIRNCVDPDRLRAIRAGDRAAVASPAAAGNGARAVRRADARGR